ncbi:hypothetical protein K449DRAFT_403004 [Hypoxylon sp. EC38]|nr:hypothetical protein K449DRAFT_403004 [Hypoxylon sp. EC38]
MADHETLITMPSDGESGSPNTLHLPVEIIGHLISVLPEYMIPYLWWKLRCVCKSWKAEVERAFRIKYLTNTSIIFDTIPLGVSPSTVHLSFEFNRLSEDDDAIRAYFLPKSADNVGFEEFAHEALQTNPAPYRTFNHIHHQVTMAGVAISDPDLEGFNLDQGRREVSVLWKPMISQLMGDELRLRRQACKLIKEKLAQDPEQQAGGPYRMHKPRDTASQKTSLWMIQRHRSFIDEIIKVREARFQKRYEQCGVQFESIEAHDGHDSAPYFKSDQMWWVRIRFRSPADYMEL